MRSLAFIILSPVYMTLLSNLIKFDYSFKQAPPTQQTMMLAILVSVGQSLRLAIFRPIYLISFYLRLLTFQTHFDTSHLSPLLKLESRPIENFLKIFPAPPTTPVCLSAYSLPILLFRSRYNLLFFSSGTLDQNSSISVGETCQQHNKAISMSLTLSWLFYVVSKSTAMSFLSQLVRTPLRYIQSQHSLYWFSFLALASLMSSDARFICISIFFCFSLSSFTSFSFSFYPISLTLMALSVSFKPSSLIDRFLFSVHIQSLRSTSKTSFLSLITLWPLGENLQIAYMSPAQLIPCSKTGKQSDYRLKKKTML